MIVVGGGVIGCESACIFAALGVRVTLINSRHRLLAHLDKDVSDALRQSMTSRLGITVHGDAEVRSVTVENGRAHVVLSDDVELDTDCVLVSTGRVGNSAAIECKRIGVKVNDRGYIIVDRQYRTAVPPNHSARVRTGLPVLPPACLGRGRAPRCTS